MLTDFLFFGGYDRALELCIDRSATGKQTKIFTPNAEMLASASKDKSLFHLLKSADIPLPDGIGVYLGAHMLGLSPVERTNGIDFAERLLSEAAKNGMKIFLLGAKLGVADAAARKLQKKFKGLRVAGTHHGYFQKNGRENDAVIKKINRSGTEILFVCFGFPEQERWIAEYLPKLENVKIAAGLGGSLDVWSGEVDRAPDVLRNFGGEWLWRAAKDPTRLSRIPKLFGFALLCTLSKLSNFAKRKSNLLQNR
jgi:N-acetylglucosaminyldiphosphoundecaprenol N-acetyl-beta-D-mannosaminyltransferase